MFHRRFSIDVADFPLLAAAAVPEKQFAVLQNYLPAQDRDFFQDFRAAVNEVTDPIVSGPNLSVTGITRGPGSEQAFVINQARRSLRRLLDQLLDAKLFGDLDEIYDLINNREYKQALNKIGALAPEASPGVTQADISKALIRQDVAYTQVIDIGPIDSGHGPGSPFPGNDFPFPAAPKPVGGGKPVKKIVKGVLSGYSGPALGRRRIQLFELQSLLSGGKEFDFRTGVLKAECQFGQRRFKQARSMYKNLLEAPAQPTDMERRFLFLRSGQIDLAQGDARFRTTRDVGASALDQAKRDYKSAQRMMAGSNVPTKDPERLRIERYAASQIEKIDNRLNYLGFRDSFVPPQRHTVLEDRVQAHIAGAGTAVDRFERYLKSATDLEDAEKQLEFEQTTAATNVEIAEQRLAIGEKRIAGADVRIEALSDQETFLTAETVVGGLGAIAQTAAFLGAFGSIKGDKPPGVAGSIGGLASSVVGFLARRQELEHQKRAAEIERQIADLEKGIAELEVQLAESKLAFVKDASETVRTRRMNKNLYYELAKIYQDLAQSHLDAAIRFAYLYERAVAFFLGKPDLRHIQFSYLEQMLGSESFIPAPALLEADVAKVKDAFADPSLPEPVAFEETISLRATYPIAFASFSQTGLMDFSISLYDLDKRRPGTYQRRIVDVAVQVIGLIPPTGFSGRLTHHGSFLIRDRTSSLDPATTRLIPTDEQLAQALEQQGQGDPAAAVAGVVPFTLDKDTNELSAATQQIKTEKQQIFTLPFEGYGPAGLWTLELDNLDLRGVADVMLKIQIESAERDVDLLQPKIEALIRQYEQELSDGDALDKITAISMRRQFADPFFQLENGQADITLTEENFPSGMTDLKAKAVLLQAIDQDGEGIDGLDVTISKQGTSFSVMRSTGADGFSEDVGAEIPVLDPADRFPATGTWSLQLDDPSQFDRNGDIIWFFLYAFTPA